jgi:hypothetical protein
VYFWLLPLAFTAYMRQQQRITGAMSCMED